MDPFAEDEARSHAAHNSGCPREPESLPNSIDGFDARAMRTHQIRHFEVFQLVGSPIQLVIGSREEMQSADDCFHWLIRKLLSGKRENVYDSRMSAAGDHDQPFRCIEHQ